jgi:hypothetical protein
MELLTSPGCCFTGPGTYRAGVRHAEARSITLTECAPQTRAASPSLEQASSGEASLLAPAPAALRAARAAAAAALTAQPQCSPASVQPRVGASGCRGARYSWAQRQVTPASAIPPSSGCVWGRAHHLRASGQPLKATQPHQKGAVGAPLPLLRRAGRRPWARERWQLPSM